MMGRLMIATAAVFVAATPVAAQNVPGNGDFEAGGTGVGAPVPFWAVENTGDPYSVQVVSGRFYSDCCAATGSTTELSNQFVTLGANGSPTNVRDRLYQSFQTDAGLYRLAFDYGSIGGPQALHFSIYDFDRAQFILNLTAGAQPSDDLDQVFTRFSTVFRSAGGEHSVQFSADGSDTRGADLLLDNVEVSRLALTPVGGVPEPAVWAFLLLGFGAIGRALRRRAPGRMAAPLG